MQPCSKNTPSHHLIGNRFFFSWPGAIAGAESLTKYDSVDADVIQSYAEYSLASLLYYAMKVTPFFLQIKESVLLSQNYLSGPT